MNVFEWQARATEQSARVLTHSLSMTQEDKLDWSPAVDASSKTRPILEQMYECALVNRRFAALLRGETPPPPPSSDGPAPTFADLKEARNQVMESATELAAVIRSLDESALTNSYPTGRGPMTGADLIRLPATNMIYHWGQVNYVQTLYGDTEFHLPPREG